MTPAQRISVQPEAQEEITHAVGWYEARSPGLGARFRAAINNCLTRIAENPKAYAAVRGEVRRAPVQHFPYSVIYLPDDANIVILACFHASRDPAEWERRAPI